MIKQLRQLNFDKLISVSAQDVGAYTYDDYRRNGYEHKPITGYCISCEKKGYSIAKDDDSFKLTNISHGSHSSDFFRSLTTKQNTNNWHQDPIVFIYEPIPLTIVEARS